MNGQRDARNAALINGMLIAAGVIGVADNIIAHWILDLHRAVPGSWAVPVEVILVFAGALALAIGTWRELAARSPAKEPSRRPNDPSAG